MNNEDWHQGHHHNFFLVADIKQNSSPGFLYKENKTFICNIFETNSGEKKHNFEVQI